MTWITETPRGVTLNVHATPRASKNQIQGLHGDAVKIRLRAPPVEGKANASLVAYLAETLDLPERDVVLLSGETGRRKRIAIANLDLSTVAARLGLPLPV